ncbi:hypothetical protein [Kaarinaea lacus]
MNRLIRSTVLILSGVLFCAAAYALGPPGPARNGGTGNGIDNFNEQTTPKPVEQKTDLIKLHAQQIKGDEQLKYFNAITLSSRNQTKQP